MRVSTDRPPPRYVRGLEQQVEQLSAQLEAQAAGSSSSVKSGFSAHNQYANHGAPPSGSPGTSTGLSATPPTTTTTTARARQRGGQEVTAINSHTRNVEFYGSSSSVALLSQVQRGGERSPASSEAGGGAAEHSESDAVAAALLSNLHNPAFSPPSLDAPDKGGPGAGGSGGGTTVLTVAEAQLSAMEPAYYRQCSVFLHNFFSTMHYIHPMIDKTSFLERCEVLWSGDKEAMRQHASFVPLYFSILSIGALVGYRDIEPVGGVSNQKWSRRFFNEARARFKELELATDLEMVQTFFFMVGTPLSSQTELGQY